MIELANIEDVSRIADWVELNVVYFNKPISRAKLVSLLQANGFEKDIDYDEDTLLDSVMQELQRRQLLYGAAPPIMIENSIVVPLCVWNDRPEYFMCLLFSYWGAANAGIGTQLFERISNIVLRSYLNGDTLNLGFPNEGDLPGQLDHIAATLREDRAAMNPPVAAKDRGVDVIGWLSCGDDRNGQVIILMQCAAGRHWNSKKRIMLDVWSQYINWNFYTTIPSLSITEVVDKNKWSEAVVQYGVVFDRARIFKYLYKPSVAIDANLRTEVVNWCNGKMA